MDGKRPNGRAAWGLRLLQRSRRSCASERGQALRAVTGGNQSDSCAARKLARMEKGRERAQGYGLVAYSSICPKKDLISICPGGADQIEAM